MAGWAAAGEAAAKVGTEFLQENQARDDATTAWNRQLYMANNAMQMRVEDLKKAGLNPMLAASGGLGGVGMTTSPPPIQTAQAPNINPATTAAQIANTNAQTELTKAQASKTRWETGDQLIPLDENGEPDFKRAGGGVMGNLNAQAQYQGIQNMQATWGAIKAAADKDASQADLNAAQNKIQTLNLKQQQALYDTVIRKAAAEMDIAQDQAKDWDSIVKITGNPTWGPIIKLFRMVIPGGFR